MSELKHQLMLNKERSWVPCYLKSEADKVIADLEESHKKEVEQLLMEIVELKKKLDLYKRGWEESDRINAHLYAKLRHHKHKRCLAMVDKCAETAKKYYYLICLDGSNNPKYTRFPRKMDFWTKWGQRWLKLAKKFKDNEAK